jgi:hypothetical protein
MGFMDKAKQMAEQAQQKIDEAQKKFNESQQQRAGQPGDGPTVEYDEHGRPIQQEAAAPAAKPPPGPPPSGDPTAPGDTEQQDPGQPPKMTGGDPLAG